MGTSQLKPGTSIGPNSEPDGAVTVRRLGADDDWEPYYRLRWELLREPHGQPRGSERDDDDDRADHFIALDPDGGGLGVARLHEAMPGQGQVRYMAVRPAHWGEGIGKALLQACEDHARGRGFLRIILEAREPVFNFYKQQGYVRGNPGKLLFGSLRHVWMHKRLHLDDFSPWGLELRAAHPEDRRAVSELIFAVLGEYDLSVEPEGIDRDLEGFPGFYADGFFQVLADGDEIIGTVALLPLDEERCELRRMYLAPRWRGRGVGRALLGYGLGRCRERRCAVVEVETASQLTEALALYRWAGFEPTAGDCEARRCDQRLALTLQR